MDVEDWIEEEEKKGLTEQQLRKKLEENNWKPQDVNKAITKFKLRQAFKPTPIKLVLPLILLLLLISSHTINTLMMPDAAAAYCENLKEADTLEAKWDYAKEAQYSYELGAEETYQRFTETRQNVLANIQTYFEEYEKNLPLLYGNAFLMSNIQNLNPFYPQPCSINELTSSLSSSCRYYVSEESYNCIYNDPESHSGGIVSLIGSQQPYKPMNHAYWTFNAALLIVLFYIVQGIALLAFSHFHQKSNIRKAVFTLGFFFLLLAIDWVAGLGEVLLLSLIGVWGLYSLALFLKGNGPQILFGLVILLAIVGSIITIIIVHNALTGLELPEDSYSLEYCDNTEIINQSDSRYEKFLEEEYYGEVLKLCTEPSCSTICRNKGAACSSNWQVNAEKPACICRCRIR